jgi:hypothetical protein
MSETERQISTEKTGSMRRPISNNGRKGAAEKLAVLYLEHLEGVF